MVSDQSDPSERSKRNAVKEEGFRVTRLGALWIEQVIRWSSFVLAKIYVGIMTQQHHADLKPMG